MTHQIAFIAIIILLGWALANALYPIAQEFVIGLVTLEKALDTIENEEK